MKFRNFGLHKGIVDVYAWGLSDGRDNVGEIDLRAAGVQALDTSVCTGIADPSDRCLVFAINTWTPWSNAAGDEWDVLIDVDKDGTPDYLLTGYDDGLMFTAEANGLLDALVIDLSDGSLVGGFDATVSANGTTVLLPALASDFGLQNGGPSSFDYWVESYTNSGESIQADVMNTGDSAAGTNPNARFDAFKPSLSFRVLQVAGGEQGDEGAAQGEHHDLPRRPGPEGLVGGDHGRRERCGPGRHGGGRQATLALPDPCLPREETEGPRQRAGGLCVCARAPGHPWPCPGPGRSPPAAHRHQSNSVPWTGRSVSVAWRTGYVGGRSTSTGATRSGPSLRTSLTCRRDRRGCQGCRPGPA